MVLFGILGELSANGLGELKAQLTLLGFQVVDDRVSIKSRAKKNIRKTQIK